MLIRFLGAHNCEAENARFVSLLIDDVLAIDAGAITSSLPFPAQQKIKAVLLTHQHYDHVRDIPSLGMSFFLQNATFDIYSIQTVYDALTTDLLNDRLYPNFLKRPLDKPTINFRTIVPNKAQEIDGYSVLALPVNHSVPTVGYQVTSKDGKSLFYSADSGADLAECWSQISPQLLIIETTTPNRDDEFARASGHLTPALLKQTLESFRTQKGYLPQVVAIHMNPLEEKEIEKEIAEVSKDLNIPIQLGYEGMQIQL